MPTAQDSVLPLKRVIVRRPTTAFSSADIEAWHYTSSPDLEKALAEHDAFVSIIKEEAPDAEVIYHDADDAGKLSDSIYVHDPLVVTDKGAVLLEMGKVLRKGEPSLMAKTLEKSGIPILGKLTDTWDGQGEMPTMEGGDTLWVDSKTLCIGMGYRTNKKGVECLRALFKEKGVDAEVLAYDLPYFLGPAACLHLLSLISLLSPTHAVVYPPLMPVAFHSFLVSRGFTLIPVPEKEFMDTQGTNVLAVKPGVVVMLDRNPVTKERMEKEGIKVRVYKGEDISFKAEGGPTCLTRPVLRG